MMQVHTLGDGDPEIAVVGSVHGDERCGKRAIERFLAEDPAVQRPVKLIIANEEALAADARYVDTDLNRAFPGDADSDLHEERLAARVADEVQGCTVLDLHSTQSYDEPFAIIPALSRATCRLIRATGVSNAVDMETFSGDDLISHCDGVIAECGTQQTQDASEQAYDVMRQFLAAHGVRDAEQAHTDPDLFRGVEQIPKPSPYRLLVENFERVDAGQVYAESEDHALTADEPFYPVLMSEDGYTDILGFCAEKLGALSDVTHSL